MPRSDSFGISKTSPAAKLVAPLRASYDLRAFSNGQHRKSGDTALAEAS